MQLIYLFYNVACYESAMLKLHMNRIKIMENYTYHTKKDNPASNF